MPMPRRHHAEEKALLGLMLALAPFAYKQFVIGNVYVAGVTVVAIVLVDQARRHVESQLVQAVLDSEESTPEAAKPVLLTVGRALRERVQQFRRE